MKIPCTLFPRRRPCVPTTRAPGDVYDSRNIDLLQLVAPASFAVEPRRAFNTVYCTRAAYISRNPNRLCKVKRLAVEYIHLTACHGVYCLQHYVYETRNTIINPQAYSPRVWLVHRDCNILHKVYTCAYTSRGTLKRIIADNTHIRSCIRWAKCISFIISQR